MTQISRHYSYKQLVRITTVLSSITDKHFVTIPRYGTYEFKPTDSLKDVMCRNKIRWMMNGKEVVVFNNREDASLIYNHVISCIYPGEYFDIGYRHCECDFVNCLIFVKGDEEKAKSSAENNDLKFVKLKNINLKHVFEDTEQDCDSDDSWWL